MLNSVCAKIVGSNFDTCFLMYFFNILSMIFQISLRNIDVAVIYDNRCCVSFIIINHCMSASIIVDFMALR